MSIGAVLALLRPEFPDVTISKIRFLEDQGLVEPDRSPSGYRKFSSKDVERLRYVLSVQRDHYLPLRVIREHLDALDDGADAPPLPGTTPPRIARLVPDEPGDGGAPAGTGDLTPADLAMRAQVDTALVAELESYGVIARRGPGGGFGLDAVAVVQAAAGLASFGIEPRHLRLFRTAADREAGLVEQVVAPLRHQRGAQSAGRADEVAREVAGLCLTLHEALVRAALGRRSP